MLRGRTSWYICEQCDKPHTTERPLVRYVIETERKIGFNIHEDCLSELQARVIGKLVRPFAESAK